MVNKADLTQTILREYLNYDEHTGILTWKKKPSKKAVLNTRAGSLVSTTGYRTLRLFERSYPEHHVVWCWYHGYWSDKQLDHIDHNRANNCIVNLREVTIAENARNRTRRRYTKVEEAGIWFCKRRQRYVSEITMDGRKVFQKTYLPDDIDVAISERKAKLIELGFHENHGT